MNDAKQATPPAELERQICSSMEPKNEREWWAHREIERLRDRLSVETLALVETLARAERAEAELERVKRAAINGMDAATKHGHGLVEQANRLRAESNPDALESERAMNATLTEQLERAEAALRELGKRPESCGDDCVSELARQDALAELAAAKVDAAIGAILRRRLVSSNGVPVSRAHVTADEVATIDAARGGEG